MSCWRSTLRARRKRTNSDAIEPRIARASAIGLTFSSTSISPGMASKPSGFTTVASSNGPGSNAITAPVTTIAVAANQANARQRGDGRCPSGNSSRPKVAIGPMPAIHTQVESQCTSTGAPPSLSVCVIVSPPIVYAAPPESRIHPIGLRGCRLATSAPIVAKAPTKNV